MSNVFTHSLAAFAAILIAYSSIGAIVSVPQASAQSPVSTSMLFEIA